MCSGSMDDADKAGPFLSETSSHPTSNTLHSGFCLQDDVSIRPKLVVQHSFVLYRNIVYSATAIPPLFESIKNQSSQVGRIAPKVACL